MTEVIMPKMGDGMEEGTLLEWLKSEGEKVRTGEIIGTIQTDKATLELESPGSGVLAGFLIKPGETVPVGVPIAALLKADEKLPEGWATGTHARTESAPPVVEGVVAPAVAKATEPELVAVGNGERVKASPLAKKVAAELGVALSAVKGSGPGGRIVEKDVRSAMPSGTNLAPAAIATIAPAASDQVVPLNRLRQIIAERTTQAKQQVPHFYVTVDVDVDAIFRLREQFKVEAGGNISVNDFVVKACALALGEMPVVNSAFQGTSYLQFGAVHIGVAAAVDEGLLVPVIKNADQLSLRQIAAESKRLVTRARDGKLLPDEMSGSTFSISNMGMLNVDNFVAIINTPNTAIVAISTARRLPIINDEDELELRWRMNVTGSFDHRVIDGAVGARFMNIVRDYLENPTRLLS